jgi:hypothetical protein
VAADGEVYPANQASGGQFTGGGRDHYYISHLSWRQLEGVGVLEAVRGHGGKENNGFRTLEMTLRPKELHIASRAERQYRCTPEFKDRYDARTGERAACPEGIPGCDLRRDRYIGVVKIRLERILIAAWLTLRRIGEWFADTQQVRTRIVSFVTLARAGT